jgi:hypothetical protein
MNIDPDSFAVVLSFCDVRTQLQASRVCRTARVDTLRFLKPKLKSLVPYLRKATATRHSDDELLGHLYTCTEPEWFELMVRIWVNSHTSTFVWEELPEAPQQFRLEWPIPMNSHLRQTWPTAIVLNANEHGWYMESAKRRSTCRLVLWCLKKPFVWWMAARLVLFWLETRVMSSYLWSPV